jgi:hypothetical protein
MGGDVDQGGEEKDEAYGDEQHAIEQTVQQAQKRAAVFHLHLLSFPEDDVGEQYPCGQTKRGRDQRPNRPALPQLAHCVQEHRIHNWSLHITSQAKPWRSVALPKSALELIGLTNEALNRNL